LFKISLRKVIRTNTDNKKRENQNIILAAMVLVV